MRQHIDDLCLRLLAAAQGQRGQTLAEYGLIITVIAVGVTVAAMITFRVQLIAAFNSAATCLDGAC